MTPEKIARRLFAIFDAQTGGPSEPAVIAALRLAVEGEREACAGVSEAWRPSGPDGDDWRRVVLAIAEAIRTRTTPAVAS